MCSGSYHAPKAQPTPAPPDSPGEGATQLVFNNGSGVSIEDQIKALAQIIKPSRLYNVHAPSIDDLQAQNDLLQQQLNAATAKPIQRDRMGRPVATATPSTTTAPGQQQTTPKPIQRDRMGRPIAS
jgi:hypothetical protein